MTHVEWLVEILANHCTRNRSGNPSHTSPRKRFGRFSPSSAAGVTRRARIALVRGQKPEPCYNRIALSDLDVSGRLPFYRQLCLAQISPSPYSVNPGLHVAGAASEVCLGAWVPAGCEPPGETAAWVSSGLQVHFLYRFLPARFNRFSLTHIF